MSNLEWARKEIELAKQEEITGELSIADSEKIAKVGKIVGKDIDIYANACLDSALKAYESLIEDGHSGFSFAITSGVLKRLMSKKPLTPVTKENAEWQYAYTNDTNGDVVYRSLRCPGLFKHETVDGYEKYKDINRILGIDVSHGYYTSYHGGILRVIEEMGYVPDIELPYSPDTEPYKIYTSDFYSKGDRPGEFDTVAIHYMICPDGIRKELDLYFKENEEDGPTWIEIDEEEYMQRLINSNIV